MPYTYTLRNGILIESDGPLDVEQMQEIEDEIEESPDIVVHHGARVFIPPSVT